MYTSIYFFQEICPLIHEVEEVFEGVDADFKSVAAYFCEDRNSTIDNFLGIFLKVCEDVQFEEVRPQFRMINYQICTLLQIPFRLVVSPPSSVCGICLQALLPFHDIVLVACSA